MGEPIVMPALLEKPKEKIPAEEWARRSEGMFAGKIAEYARRETAQALGVHESSLVRLGVGLGYDYRGNAFTSWPSRDVRWRPVGIVRRYSDGSKKTMAGGATGLFMARDWWTNRGPILLPEGGSDTAALLTMGLCAIGRPSNVGGVNRLIGLLKDQQNRPVIVLGENDRKPERVGTVKQCPKKCPGCSWCWPGKHGAEVTAERLSKALERPIYSRMVNGAKDSRAWLNAYGADAEGFLKSLKVPSRWLRLLEKE